MKYPRSGFTLVELLVVVAIIALLIAILLPSLNKARQSARMVVCQTHQRQLLTALQMYTMDNRGYLPPAYKSYSTLTWKGVTRTGGVYVPWYSAMFAGQYYGNKHICSSAFSSKEQYDSAGLIYCPSQTVHDVGNDVGIVINNGWNNIYNGPLAPTMFTQFRWPNRTALLIDRQTRDCYFTRLLPPGNKIPTYSHMDGTMLNIGFADGHTASYAYEQLNAASASGEVTTGAR